MGATWPRTTRPDRRWRAKLRTGLLDLRRGPARHQQTGQQWRPPGPPGTRVLPVESSGREPGHLSRLVGQVLAHQDPKVP
jgi:hypothetical protein